MNANNPEVPFIWPDFRYLAGVPYSKPDVQRLLEDSEIILGFVHGLSSYGIDHLKQILTKASSVTSNRNDRSSLHTVKVQLIVTLYPTCPTTSDVLLSLLQLQSKYPNLDVRLVTCDLWARPENTLICYKDNGAIPVILFGSSANFENTSTDNAHLTLGFLPEPLLADQWQKWFDVKWLRAVRLNEERTRIPDLVLPEGTIEAALKWQSYRQLCVMGAQDQHIVDITVDPTTGEIVAKSSDGTPLPTVSSENKLINVSPVYRKLSQLLDLGHLVSVDKSTRLAPFEVPVKPTWFGLETLKQVGSVKRMVSYKISALTEDELKKLENRRKKTSELLELFSFSLADNQRWMPKAAEDLFRNENVRISREAAKILSDLIDGDLDKFLEERRKDVTNDANHMYHDLFPDKNLSDKAIEEIIRAIKARFREAHERPVLPKLSFNRVSLPQPQDSAWKSQLGSALHLLISIVRYPRKARKNGIFFAKGMETKPLDILKAMNVLNDPFVEVFESFEAKDQAEVELNEIEEIESLDVPVEEKCRLLFKLIGQDITPSGVDNPPPAQGDSRGAGHSRTQHTLF